MSSHQGIIMGKMIKSASRWTWKSSLLFLNKIVTVIFGVFCIATGQTRSYSETVRHNDTVDYGVTPVDRYTFRGTVMNSKTQAIIENIKVALKVEIEEITVDYGVVNRNRDTIEIASVITDQMGQFEITTVGIPGNQPPWLLEAEDIDNSVNGNFNTKMLNIGLLSMTEMTDGNIGDTIVTIELDPVDVSINGIKNSSIDNSIRPIFSGKNILFNIGNVNKKAGIANLIDIKGRLIDKILIPENGIFKFNTEQISSGTYFVNVIIEDINVTTQVTVK